MQKSMHKTNVIIYKLKQIKLETKQVNHKFNIAMIYKRNETMNRMERKWNEIDNWRHHKKTATKMVTQWVAVRTTFSRY